MNSQKTPVQRPLSQIQIELEARRIRAQLLRSAGTSIGRSVARLFTRRPNGQGAQA